jgi:hypothetical protein
MPWMYSVYKGVRWMADRKVDPKQPIDVPKLYGCIRNLLRDCGYRGRSRYYTGPLWVDYENWHNMFHPGSFPVPPIDIYKNHTFLIEMISKKWRRAQLGNFEAPLWLKPWGQSHHDDQGLQLMGRISEHYDLACPSCYQRGRPTDIKDAQHQLDWADTFDKPMYVWLNPWVRDKFGDDLLHPISDHNWIETVARARLADNFAGLLFWTQVGPDEIAAGEVESGIDEAQVHAHHKHILELTKG